MPNKKMGLDKKGEVHIVSPQDSKEKFLWKYLDLHKLLDFIYSQEIHFTRLDSFLDPIEGMKSSFLRRQQLYLNRPDDPEQYNPNLPLDTRETLANEKKLWNHLEPKEYEENQKSQFVSCWFYGDRESMAMWELYSSKDSVAIKIESNKLISTISKSAQIFIEENGYRAHFLGDIIKYLKLNPFDPLQPPIKIDYSAMKKDECFKHEQEYRFLISALTQWTKEEDIPFFKLKIEIEQLGFQVICHPLMESWKKKNIEKLVQKFDFNIEVIESQIKLRKQK